MTTRSQACNLGIQPWPINRFILVTLLTSAFAVSISLTTTPTLIITAVHADELPIFTSDNITVNGTIPYVTTLADLSFQLVSSYCSVDPLPDGCDGYDPSGQSDIVGQAQIGLSAATIIANTPPDDPCAVDGGNVYNQGLHIGAVFIIFGFSLIGAGFPVLGKYVPFFAVHPFILVLGKCLGIGIILACALVHMLSPATDELTSPCISAQFNDVYTAYSFLFCMLAMFMMHFIDFLVETFLIEKLEEQSNQPPTTQVELTKGKEIPRIDSPKEESPMVIKPAPITTTQTISPMVIDQQCEKPGCGPDAVDTYQSCSGSHDDDPTSSGVVGGTEGAPVVIIHSPANHESSQTKTPKLVDGDMDDEGDHDHDQHHHHSMKGHGHDLDHHHGHSHSDQHGHSHAHSVLFIAGLKRTISAYLLEFGVTSHSIIIGLTVGIVSETELKTLLVALVFHQTFEGVALGSRIADAPLHNHLEEFFMVMLFALSAPVGIGVGVGVSSSINPNGSTYNYAAGVFDSVCAGILLYIGLVLLVKDFNEDLKRHCRKNNAMKCAMFLALWIGGGVMAFIGRYL